MNFYKIFRLTNIILANKTILHFSFCFFFSCQCKEMLRKHACKVQRTSLVSHLERDKRQNKRMFKFCSESSCNNYFKTPFDTGTYLNFCISRLNYNNEFR